MLAHIGLYVENVKKSGEFYIPLLNTIGYELVIQNDFCIALGKEGVPFFEIYGGKSPSSPIHIAFTCKSQEAVNLFYRTAIDLGAEDNGAPGYRYPEYFKNYYAGFVTDLNGHNLEGVFFTK
jgi:hypothetical protein